MKQLALAGGRVALVDESDFEKLADWPWRVDANGYATFKTGGRLTYMHRVIAAAGAGQFVDHVNGDRLDNRTENLRICTHAENMRNRKVSKSNKLGLKGVYLDRRSDKYRAEIRSHGQRFRLGYFGTPEEAHAAYVTAAAKHHGEFANSGLPP